MILILITRPWANGIIKWACWVCKIVMVIILMAVECVSWRDIIAKTTIIFIFSQFRYNLIKFYFFFYCKITRRNKDNKPQKLINSASYGNARSYNCKTYEDKRKQGKVQIVCKTTSFYRFSRHFKRRNKFFGKAGIIFLIAHIIEDVKAFFYHSMEDIASCSKNKGGYPKTQAYANQYSRHHDKKKKDKNIVQKKLYVKIFCSFFHRMTGYLIRRIGRFTFFFLSHKKLLLTNSTRW